MQYTVRNLPPYLDRAIRERARREGKSLNEVTIDALRIAFGMSDPPPPLRDFTGIAGSWIDDPAQSSALAEQRTIDPELWQ